MIRLLLVSAFSALVILSSGCGKKDDPAPTPKSNNNNTDPNDDPPATESYYFNFVLNNKQYAVKDGTSNYTINDNEFGAYYGPNFPTLYPELHLVFIFDHYPSNDDVLDMSGEAFYFDAADDLKPSLVLTDESGNEHNSIDTLDQQYYIKLNSVKFVKEDTNVFGEGIDVYLVKGICSALLDSQQGDPIILKDGSFNLLMARYK